MMKFLPVILFVSFLQGFDLLAQTKGPISIAGKQDLQQTIKGTVTDRATKLPLQGVTIQLISSPAVKQARAALNGTFSSRINTAG